jgi:hypothetical protein
MGGWDDEGFPRMRLGTVPQALIIIAIAFICGGCIWLAIPVTRLRIREDR